MALQPEFMTLSDPNNAIANALADLDSNNLATDSKLAKAAESSKSSIKNEISVRPATLEDSEMLESIEREAFPGLTPVTRISRDLERKNGLYLAAVRDWQPDDKQMGPRFAIATRAE